jgi:hypothetical protein
MPSIMRALGLLSIEDIPLLDLKSETTVIPVDTGNPSDISRHHLGGAWHRAGFSAQHRRRLEACHAAGSVLPTKAQHTLPDAHTKRDHTLTNRALTVG